MVAAAVKRGDVYLTDLSPTRGREIRKTRPCVVVSPDELNAHLQTYIVAPLTTGSVVAAMPNSGVLVLPAITSPAAR